MFELFVNLIKLETAKENTEINNIKINTSKDTSTLKLCEALLKLLPIVVADIIAEKINNSPFFTAE